MLWVVPASTRLHIYPTLTSHSEFFGFFLFCSFQTQIYDPVAVDRSQRRLLNVSWRGHQVPPELCLSHISHTKGRGQWGERERVVSGSIVQFSEVSIWKLVCLKLSSLQKHANAGFDHFPQSPGLRWVLGSLSREGVLFFYAANQ